MKYCIVMLSITAMLSYSWDFVFAANEGNTPYQVFPIYDLSEPQFTLAVEVREKNYPEDLDYRTLLAVPINSSKYDEFAAEITVSRYIDSILQQQDDSRYGNSSPYGQHYFTFFLVKRRMNIFLRLC